MTGPRNPSAEIWPPARHALLACALLAAASLFHSAGAETMPPGDAARINDNPIAGDWDERAKIRETCVATCRQAVAAEPQNLRLTPVPERIH
jgi:hypothetical protein